MGIGYVPYWLMAAEIHSGEVQVLLPELHPDRIPVHLVFPTGRRMPMRVRAFVDYLMTAYVNTSLPSDPAA